jgi:hypothetical protein
MFMTRRSLFRSAQAALVALLLLSPAALAQGSSASTPEDGDGFFASVWSFFTELVFGQDDLDTRCGIDPNGCPGAGSHVDTRCTIDPNGGGSCEPGF